MGMFNTAVLRVTQQRLSLKQAVTNAGLLSRLKLCMDAGDSQSYTSGQSWLDRSGGGYDFFLGADGTATATDPTFTGNAGQMSAAEYWSFDGGDYFTYDTTNETWMQNLHKNGAAFTILAAVYIEPTTGAQGFLGTQGASTNNVGCIFHVTADEKLSFIVGNGTGLVLNVAADSAVTTGAWQLVAVSLDEAAGSGGGFFWRNGAYDQVSASNTFTSTYTSPSASNAAATMGLGSFGGATGALASGARMGALAVWESAAMTKAELDLIFTQVRTRWAL